MLGWGRSQAKKIDEQRRKDMQLTPKEINHIQKQLRKAKSEGDYFSTADPQMRLAGATFIDQVLMNIKRQGKKYSPSTREKNTISILLTERKSLTPSISRKI